MVTDGSLATPDPPASGVSADAEPQRGQARTGQSEDGNVRRAVPVAAARVGRRGEQQAEDRAEKIFLVPYRPEDEPCGSG